MRVLRQQDSLFPLALSCEIIAIHQTICYTINMEHQGYARHAGAVFSRTYPLVFCPKYRKAVWGGAVEERLQALVAAKAQALKGTWHTLAVMPDHVHLFRESDPSMAPANLAAPCTGSPSRVLRQACRHLRSQLPSLWSRSYDSGSVGPLSDATGRCSLANQQGRHEMRTMMRYRLSPSEVQAEALDAQLGEACRLYHAALQERRGASQRGGLSLTYDDQAKQLQDMRSAGDLGLANFSASQDVFRRVRAGAVKPGSPRFTSRRRCDSYTFPSWGDGCRRTDADRLSLQGVGHLKVTWHRPVQGIIKTVTVTRQADLWSVCFRVEYVPETAPVPEATGGIAGGLTAFATLSTGETIANPRHARKAQRKLRRAQRRVARRPRGGRNRSKAVVLLHKAPVPVQNQRADFHHHTARTLVDPSGVIAVEDVHVQGLARGMLAHSVREAGWSAFLDKLMTKAAEAGRQVVQVNPRGTSPTCLCGAPVPKTLSQRWHACAACGLSAARDHVSAQRILGLGLSLLGLT